VTFPEDLGLAFDTAARFFRRLLSFAMEGLEYSVFANVVNRRRRLVAFQEHLDFAFATSAGRFVRRSIVIGELPFGECDRRNNECEREE
jgi:hypothetical protein